MDVAMSGWFSGRAVGSGQYTDALVAALRAAAGPDDTVALIVPGRRGSNLGKVAFEQIVFPRMAREADVAHVPYWAPPLWPAVPTVVTVHDLAPLLLPAYRRSVAARLYAAIAARATERAAAVLADSESTAADVRDHLGVPAASIHVVPLGVRAAFTASGPPMPGLPPRYGLYVGGFDPRKNVACLLEAWVGVHAATGVPLVVAGALPADGDRFLTDPREAARRVGLPPDALLMVGAVAQEDLPALYRGAAVFAYPSRFEGFGLPPLEAMACGTPVVASSATSLPEVVGDAGRLVSPDDPAAWSEAIREVLEDPVAATALREAGLRRAAAFPWSETARRTAEVYLRVAG